MKLLQSVLPQYKIITEGYISKSLNILITSIQDGFEQKGFRILEQLEAILIENNAGIEMTQVIAEFYGSDLQHERLKTKLIALHCSALAKHSMICNLLVSSETFEWG